MDMCASESRARLARGDDDTLPSDAAVNTTYTLTVDGKEFEFIPLPMPGVEEFQPFTPRGERIIALTVNAEGQELYRQWLRAFRDDLRAGVQHVDDLASYFRLCQYPYYLVAPWRVEVWVPARFYQIARRVIENLRVIGMRVDVMIEDL
jgi:hypothetical protein